MNKLMATLALTALPMASFAQSGDEYGTTNPLESGFGRVMEDIANGKTDMMTCATGYYIAKSARYPMARKLFEACAEAGYTQAMTWMSYLDDNGFGGEYDPDAASAWDLRAAQAGDEVGKFNYGLDLMRGHGVARDEVRGRALVDQAAAAGLEPAQRLRNAGYDLDVVTPDADEWKYAPGS